MVLVLLIAARVARGMSQKRSLADALPGPGSKRPASGASTLRGVAVPQRWFVMDGSLLVHDFKREERAVTTGRYAVFDFDGCLASTPLGGSDPKA